MKLAESLKVCEVRQSALSKRGRLKSKLSHFERRPMLSCDTKKELGRKKVPIYKNPKWPLLKMEHRTSR